MALAALAKAADLAKRNIVITDGDVNALLASASAGVRDAAGCSITEATGTVTLTGDGSRWLTLPGYAITAVSSVQLDDRVITDYRLVNGRLYRSAGWGDYDEPSFATVTYAQGLTSAPADIVDLVCSLVAAGASRAADGYDPNRGVSSERIDDYQRSFTRGDDEVVSPMTLPANTRAWLAHRFGGGAHVTRGVS